PAYFKSDYCGKEMKIFLDRCAGITPAGGQLPPLIKPLVWVPFDAESVPAALKHGQYTFGDPGAVHNREGVKYVLKQIARYGTEYNDLVKPLAKEIIDAAKAHPIPRLDHVAPLEEIPSLFGAPALPLTSQPNGDLSPSGPKHVRFVYIAASPQSFKTARNAD